MPNEFEDKPVDAKAVSRRGALQGGAVAAVLPFLGGHAWAQPALQESQREFARLPHDPLMPGPGEKTAAEYPVGEPMHKLASYISQARSRPLPPEVIERARWSILDTFAATVAGSQLPAGVASAKFAKNYGGRGVSTVIGDMTLLGPMEAAMLNGTMAHADETDDVVAGPWHPGINTVPAALALGEQLHVNGEHFMRAVVVGYDVGSRIELAAGVTVDGKDPTNSLGGIFGATATAAAIAGLNEEQTRWALSYAAQQCAGIDSFRRDPEHIEKGFMNGGLGARAGVSSAMMAKAGFSAVADVFSGPSGFFDRFGAHARPETIADKLGEDYFINRVGYKRWPVGAPIQAALDGLLVIYKDHKVDASQVREIRIKHIPEFITDNAGPLDINVQHAVALMLLDKKVTYSNVNDYSRRHEPALVRLRGLCKIVPQPPRAYTGPNIPAIELVMADGTHLAGDAPEGARGGPGNPYTREWIVSKARTLMTPVIGAASTHQIIERCLNIEKVKNILELRPFLQVKSGGPPRLSDWPNGAMP